MPEFRKDPVVERWVIIAAERSKRPQSKLARTATTQSGICPFCAGNESMTPPPTLILADGKPSIHAATWSVRVVPNKYPALINQEFTALQTDGLYNSMNGAGVHEVIIESPRHVTAMAALSVTEIDLVLYAYQQRLLHLRRDPRWRYALLYKNEGVEAGATLPHSHSQITALPMVPTAPREEMEGAKRYFYSSGRCVYCDIVEREKKSGERVVAETERFIVFCPFASRVACEMWILPKRHWSCFEFGSRDDFPALAQLLRETLVRLSRGFDEPAFNYFLHNHPLDEPEKDHCHWHLEILPKLNHVAGFEWGSGCYMNPMAPEDAARLLRDVAL
ncbi:MAG: galactose-1-phosphate uridylyltransferase [Deltaproteobacteria bacterium]|nr:galactose-1-phosphate uridylyltransferase [Deltaproteobacteria bacterium]